MRRTEASNLTIEPPTARPILGICADETLDAANRVEVEPSSRRPGGRTPTGQGLTDNRTRHKGLIRLESAPKRLDALLEAYSVWLIDRPRSRTLRPLTRYNYLRRVVRSQEIANAAGYSLLAGDERVVRFVLMQLSPNATTRNGYITALKSLFEFLRAKGLRTDNPAAEVGRPTVNRGVPRPLDAEICRRYEIAAAGLGAREEMIAVLGLYQGWRRNEMRLAEWSWFFESEGSVWADVQGKGGKVARVPVHPRVVAAMLRLRESHSDARWLFASGWGPRLGEPVSETWMRTTHLRILASAGIEGRVVLHQLRHSYATQLRRNGADVALIQKGLRHASPETTMVYMRVFDDELDSAQRLLSYEPG